MKELFQRRTVSDDVEVQFLRAIIEKVLLGVLVTRRDALRYLSRTCLDENSDCIFIISRKVLI